MPPVWAMAGPARALVSSARTCLRSMVMRIKAQDRPNSGARIDGCNCVRGVLEDDPGRDLGEIRQIGHRFFFSIDEVELVESATSRKRIDP